MTEPASSARPGNRQLGNQGEERVAAWYVSQGYEIEARNWRCRNGELDIVARGPNVLVFCEVKTRSGGRFGAPAEAVTPRKAFRIRQLASAYLAARNGPFVSDIRFDVGSVGPAGLEVVTSAF